DDITITLPAAKCLPPTNTDEYIAKRAYCTGSRSDLVLTLPLSFPMQGPPLPLYTSPTKMTHNQHKFCFSTVHTLKRPKDAGLFLHLINPVTLNILHYPLIIKCLMDFNMVETGLQNSNTSEPPVDPLAQQYHTTDDFATNTCQFFQNYHLFNGT
ncbi:hypothetical protein FRC06_006810, partial [Ceratobasidium sp. 370]